jgi:tetratricopeptide (TPR) repeat protein
LFEKAVGRDDLSVPKLLTSSASLYRAEGKYAQAEPLLQRALTIREKALGPEHPDVAQSLWNLAGLYAVQGKYAQAEPLYQRALTIRESALGPAHPFVGDTLASFAALYYAEGVPSKAEPLFDRTLENLGNQCEYDFSYMSEKERLEFVGNVASFFQLYFSFCFAYGDSNPALIGKMYDALLWQKGLASRSIAALRAQIAASGDPEAIKMLDRLTAKKTQLSKLLIEAPSDRAQWRKRVEELEQEANDLERVLVKRSTVLAEDRRLARVTWRDVQKGLGPHEGAVEFVRFQFCDGKKWTPTVYYAALIVTAKSTTAPTFVMLGDEGMFLGPQLRDYRQGVSPRGPSAALANGSFYKAFWQPLEAALADAKRIYVAPDGLLNQVSLGIVTTSDGRLLMEKYHLRMVLSQNCPVISRIDRVGYTIGPVHLDSLRAKKPVKVAFSRTR